MGARREVRVPFGGAVPLYDVQALLGHESLIT